MLLVPSHGSRCTRCALRLKIHYLQQHRRRSSAQSYEPSHNDGDSLVRYGASQGRRSSDSQRVRFFIDRTSPADQRKPRYHREENSIISKFASRGSLKQWGLDKKYTEKRKQQEFRDVLLSRLQKVKDEVKDAPILEQLAREGRDGDGGQQLQFGKLWKDFTQKILRSSDGRAPFSSGDMDGNAALWQDLASAWRIRGTNGLDDRIKYAFYGHVTTSRFTVSEIRNQKTLADLRFPNEWYPATRAMNRTIHLHVGPTNSGKTFQALQRLEQAKSGIYAGPLRLLAHEVYSRMNAKGIPCWLITGEERRMAEGEVESGHHMSACTVEMIPLNMTLDVAVIDEIQMIGNAERGWAWTQALLGVKAKEVHLCGEERTIPLIRELCASVGEQLEIHHYQRLSPLQVADAPLDGDLTRLRKGDCIVSFSVMGIHALRRQIEKATNRKVATVYGSLPPETRAQQARLFNDPNNDYDYLVASDAVGMGLNLAIKRIVFEASSKFDGVQRRTLSIADIKQIGGRAGRFRTAAQASEAPLSQQELATAKGDPPNQDREDRAWRGNQSPENVGLVTTLERFDYPIIKTAMESEPEPIQTAGLFPPAPVLERFASYFPPGTPFSYILTRLHEFSQMHKRFHLCGLKDQVWIADVIEPIQGLTVADRNIFCSAPASKTDAELWQELMPAFARCVAEQSTCSIADIEELPLETLEAEVTPSREYLRDLERLHKGIVTYLWLSYRFQGIFNTRALAFHVKGLVEEKIEHVLGQFSFTEAQRRKLAARREKEIMKSLLAAQESSEYADEGADKSAQSTPRSVIAHTDSVEEHEDPERDIEDKLADLAGERHNAPNAENAESEIGAELEGSARIIDTIDNQTSLTAGGDRFGGEEDLGLEEPEIEAERLDRHQRHGSTSQDPTHMDDLASDGKTTSEHTAHAKETT